MKQILSEADEQNNIIGGIAVDRLRSLIERIEHLEEENVDNWNKDIEVKQI